MNANATVGHGRIQRLDLSDVIRLRKRIGRAQLGIKLGGLSGAPVFAFLGVGPILAWVLGDGATAIWVTLSFISGCAFAWGSFWLAARFRRGSEVAVRILTVTLVPYVAFALYWTFSFVDTAILRDLLVASLWFGTSFLMLQGLWARVTAPENLAVLRGVSPWETQARVRRPRAFASKRRLSLFLLLLLLPIPWLLVTVSQAVNQDESQDVFESESEFLGQQVGAVVVPLLLWLPLTAIVYRRARESAVIKATELPEEELALPVLYLRSFGDDKLKMRARAANGRWWLEWIFPVRFEEVVVDYLFRHGPVVAIGQPGEKSSLLGAVRDYLPDGLWQQRVESLMHEASAIVVVVGRTEGLAWELGKLAEHGLMDKLVLLLPPTGMDEIEQRWVSLRTQLSDLDVTTLPIGVDLTRLRAAVIQHGAPLLIFSEARDDWSYETCLDCAFQAIAQSLGPDLVSPVHTAGIASERLERSSSLAGAKHSRLVEGGRRLGIPQAFILGGFVTLAGLAPHVLGSESTSSVSLLDLAVGDCFNSPSLTDEIVLSVTSVDCDGSWRYRVVGLIEVEADGTFPGIPYLESQANTRCPSDTQLFLYPTNLTWIRGDRGIKCITEFSSSTKTVNVLELTVGDCFNSPSLAHEIVFNVTLVDCAGSWRYRVVGLIEVEADGTFPGIPYLESQANLRCPSDTQLFLYPTTTEWSLGKRSIWCVRETLSSAPAP